MILPLLSVCQLRTCQRTGVCLAAIGIPRNPPAIRLAQITDVQCVADVDNITHDTRQVLANVNDLTGEANRKHVAEILANTDAMIARTSPQIDRIAKNVEAVTAKMGPTVDNVNATVTNANGSITVLRDRTQADLVELQKTLVDVRSLVDNLQVVVRSNQQNISYTLDNIRMATDHLDDLTESVDERPWSLIRIRQPKDRNVPKNSEGK